ncbi:hypothetical protein PUN28_012471 [Cardiocondyla obscurior]|uniref:Secreted protein n=1 Tax=Cardiocondyla obscurior TaxID=286306 RepID=A0AAW2FGP5_9HYME
MGRIINYVNCKRGHYIIRTSLLLIISLLQANDTHWVKRRNLPQLWKKLPVYSRGINFSGGNLLRERRPTYRPEICGNANVHTPPLDSARRRRLKRAALYPRCNELAEGCTNRKKRGRPVFPCTLSL